MELEQKLKAFDPKIASDHMSNRQWQTDGISPSSGVTDLQDVRPSKNAEREIDFGTGFVALSSYPYLGTSSGQPLAKIVQSAINLSILTGGGRDQHHETSDTPRNDGPMVKEGGDGPIHPTAGMPMERMSHRLIEAYIDKVHSKHPFLSQKRIMKLHERRKDLRPCGKQPCDQQLVERLDHFVLHMVYAIGARYLQLSDDYDYVPPESHYGAAIQDINVVFDVRGLENLECMLLLAIYQLRSPSGLGIWGMIGITMRHCLDSGLHRKSTLPNLLDQRRKRVFWTVYMLERSVARTLGRPCCVTDREIDVDLPANVSDAIEDEEELIVAIEQARRNPRLFTPLSAPIHIIRIQKIESKIHHTVYRVDKGSVHVPAHKISRLRDALEEWRSHITDVVPPCAENESVSRSSYSQTDYHLIQYYKAILLLLLPSLPSLQPTHADFRLCAFAAGQICQLYKHWHDSQQYLSFSLLALHANFVAGLTMVYCFSLDKTIFDWKFSSDIRACSTVLYIIAERWPAARKVKDAFESLVTATIERGAAPGDSMTLPSTSSISHPAPTTIPNALPDGPRSPHGEGLNPFHYGDNPSNDVWDLFGTVFDDKDTNWRWAEEGFYNAMGAFPEYGWML